MGLHLSGEPVLHPERSLRFSIVSHSELDEPGQFGEAQLTSLLSQTPMTCVSGLTSDPLPEQQTNNPSCPLSRKHTRWRAPGKQRPQSGRAWVVASHSLRICMLMLWTFSAGAYCADSTQWSRADAPRTVASHTCDPALTQAGDRVRRICLWHGPAGITGAQDSGPHDGGMTALRNEFSTHESQS